MYLTPNGDGSEFPNPVALARGWIKNADHPGRLAISALVY